MRNFDTMAQEVWAAKTVEAKRAVLHEMVDMFQHKYKQPQFHEEIDFANFNRCDFLASSLALNDTDKVIK